jgi:hypothetical protein
MSTWRARFLDLTNRQVKALQEENIDELMDAGDQVVATLRLHDAAGKPGVWEEMDSTLLADAVEPRDDPAEGGSRP